MQGVGVRRRALREDFRRRDARRVGVGDGDGGDGVACCSSFGVGEVGAHQRQRQGVVVAAGDDERCCGGDLDELDGLNAVRVDLVAGFAGDDRLCVDGCRADRLFQANGGPDCVEWLDDRVQVP